MCPDLSSGESRAGSAATSKLYMQFSHRYMDAPARLWPPDLGNCPRRRASQDGKHQSRFYTGDVLAEPLLTLASRRLKSFGL